MFAALLLNRKRPVDFNNIARNQKRCCIKTEMEEFGG
jgi:hypothetical protein